VDRPRQPTITDEDKEKKVKKEKTGKEVGGAATKSHVVEGSPVAVLYHEWKYRDNVLNIAICMEKWWANYWVK